MSDTLWGMGTSPEMRHAQQLEYSVMMVSDIATRYDRTVDAGDFLAASCMLDAFYVHLRLLGDFLVMTTSGRDFGPAQFGVAWAVPTSEEAVRLAANWRTASSYVVHFGRPRVAKSIEDLTQFEIGGPAFKAMARDGLKVFAVFLRALRIVTPDSDARVPDRTTEPGAWQDKVLADRTNFLRMSFVEACKRVGLDGERLLIG